MQRSSKEKTRILPLLRWSLNHGRRWCGIYWKEEFTFNHLVVNAASIPLYQLQLIEQGSFTIQDLARMLSKRLIDEGSSNFNLYLALWDEAISFALGCRQDSLLA